MHVSFVEYTAATVRFSPPVVGLAQMAFANKTGRAFDLDFAAPLGSLYHHGIIKSPPPQMCSDLRRAIRPETNSLVSRWSTSAIPEHSSGIVPARFFLSLAYT